MSSTSVPNLALQRTNANNSCRVLPQNEIMQFKSLSNGSQRWTLCQERNGSIISTSEHYWTGHVPSSMEAWIICARPRTFLLCMNQIHPTKRTKWALLHYEVFSYLLERLGKGTTRTQNDRSSIGTIHNSEIKQHSVHIADTRPDQHPNRVLTVVNTVSLWQPLSGSRVMTKLPLNRDHYGCCISDQH